MIHNTDNGEIVFDASGLFDITINPTLYNGDNIFNINRINGKVKLKCTTCTSEISLQDVSERCYNCGKLFPLNKLFVIKSEKVMGHISGHYCDECTIKYSATKTKSLETVIKEKLNG